VTGYIGGDALHQFTSQHSDWEYAALVRGEKGAAVSQAYPNVRIVNGGLDDAAMIEEESAKADIVLHTADSSDHAGAAAAIAAGLAKGHSAEKPGFWLHVSGAGILTYQDSDAERYGEPHDKVYNDLEGVAELTNLPDHAFHRNVDKLVLGSASDAVRVAVICPPTIYGPGRGPVNSRSRQLYALVRSVLTTRKAPIIGRGLARWNFVHVHDLSKLYVLLAQAAAAKNLSADLWGSDVYFLAENGEHAWGDVSRWVAEAAVAKGLIPAVETVEMKKDEALELAGFDGVSWGWNSRGEARRARKFLGWEPTGPSVKEEIPGIIDMENMLLQKD
jgi:nucleoside-diphosphate-sugar epimerase